MWLGGTISLFSVKSALVAGGEHFVRSWAYAVLALREKRASSGRMCLQ
jgi:hypothetical protein